MQLVGTEQITIESRHLKLIDYGEPGTGKTWFGASAALSELTAPALFLDYRSQIASLRINEDYLRAINEGRLIILRLDKYSELTPVYNWLKKGRGSYKTLDAVMEQFGHPKDLMPKTIVTDSTTELQRSEVLRRAGNDESVFTGDIIPAEIQHWNVLLNQFTTLAHMFFKLPYHIVFSGLEAIEYGNAPVGKTPPIESHRIALQGAAQRLFPAYALTVMRLDHAPKGSKHFNVGITRSVKSKTKEQTGYFPQEIPNPTIPMLVRMLNQDE